MMVRTVMLLAATAALAVPVPNAGLEDGAQAPSGWDASVGEGGTAEFAWVTEPVHSGRRGFRVTRTDGLGFSRLSSDFLPVEAGKTYRVTAWVYALKSVKRGVYFMLSQYPAESAAENLPNAFGDTGRSLVKNTWQMIDATVTIRPGSTRLRIHCIQAFAPSDLVWDEFAVAEAAEAPKPRYEKPEAEVLPPLESARAVVAKRAKAQVRVDTSQGRPRLFVDGQPVPWAFYVSPFWNPNDAQVADFRQAGARVYLVPLVLGWQVYGERGPWRGPGQYDFTEVDELLWRVLRVDPAGYVMFYMACDPYKEWGKEHPDDVTCDQNGLKAIVEMHPKRWGEDPVGRERYAPSLVSQRLRDETAETLRRLVAHVEQSEAGKAVIGYHVAGSNDGQWFWWASFDPKNLHLADYSPAAQASFRAWLRRRYGDVAGLRRAWARPDLTFEQAAVPAAERYWADGFLVDPATQQDLADYTRFYSEGVAETVMGLAATIKQASPRRVLCGTYYEDITCNSPNHIALRRLLTDDALDFLAGPAAYGIRLAGYQGAVRSVFGSTLLHHKTYLTEQDWRSFRSHPDSPENNRSWGRAETAEIHNAMVRRECGMMLAYGLGTWWYDMSGGWFRDDGIMAGIREALGAFRRDLSVPGIPTADLAVIVSEDSNHYVMPKQGGLFRYSGIVQQIHELNLAGVPYRLYLQADLGAGLVPPHRAYLFLNAYRLDAAERQAVERLKRDGRLLIFAHAPGVVGAAEPAAEVGKVTGLKVQPVALDRLVTRPELGRHPLQQDLEAGAAISGGFTAPGYAVTDDRAVPLARWVGADGVAAAARDFGTWKSAFVGVPGLSAELVNNLARWAGCWVAAPPGDAVYAAERCVTIHALSPGRKVLTLRGPSRVEDLTSGQVVAQKTTSITVEMARAETRWFWLTPAR